MLQYGRRGYLANLVWMKGLSLTVGRYPNNVSKERRRMVAHKYDYDYRGNAKEKVRQGGKGQNENNHGWIIYFET